MPQTEQRWRARRKRTKNATVHEANQYSRTLLQITGNEPRSAGFRVEMEARVGSMAALVVKYRNLTVFDLPFRNTGNEIFHTTSAVLSDVGLIHILGEIY